MGRTSAEEANGPMAMDGSANSNPKIRVFYSYAHRDEAFREQLEAHLSTLRRRGFIEEWHDRNIDAGTEWARQISTHLEDAQIILLLVSPDFINSEYCYSIEGKRALQRQEMGEARVIPIILRPTYWQVTPFSHLQALPKEGKPITDWDNRDSAYVDIVRGIHNVIKTLFPDAESQDIPTGSTATGPLSGAPTQTASAPAQPWNVPFHRNPFFTGREQLLALLRERLTSGKTAALTQAQAISGLGGIGKTQTAVEYAHRYRDQYRAVLWASAASLESLQSDFVQLAHLLKLPEKDAREQNITIEAVQRWLAQHRDWLLILDNADDLPIIDAFLPDLSATNGHILITTRSQAAGTLAAPIAVEKMDQQEGTLLLLRRARLLAPGVPLAQAIPTDRTQAEAIVSALDGLPLALDQAGAYIEETGCTLADYLTYYSTQPQRPAGLAQQAAHKIPAFGRHRLGSSPSKKSKRPIPPPPTCCASAPSSTPTPSPKNCSARAHPNSAPSCNPSPPTPSPSTRPSKPCAATPSSVATAPTKPSPSTASSNPSSSTA